MPNPLAANPIRTAARISGLGLMVAGVLGFAGLPAGILFPGTSGLSVPLSLALTAVGLTGAIATHTILRARSFLIGVGAFYLLLLLLGRVGGRAATASGDGVGADGDWVRWAAGAALIVLGLTLGRTRRSGTVESPPTPGS